MKKGLTTYQRNTEAQKHEDNSRILNGKNARGQCSKICKVLGEKNTANLEFYTQ